jgi:hypothetical protein
VSHFRKIRLFFLPLLAVFLIFTGQTYPRSPELNRPNSQGSIESTWHKAVSRDFLVPVPDHSFVQIHPNLRSSDLPPAACHLQELPSDYPFKLTLDLSRHPRGTRFLQRICKLQV